MAQFRKYTKTNYPALERRWLDWWRADNTFQKSIDQRPADNTYIFYDGPPFITGSPHHGTLLSSIVKDVIPRFKTMVGYRVPRRWGWDCHGLPAEIFVEQKLGLKDKQAVLDYGLADYNRACRESMVQTGSEWEDTIARVARWVDFRGAYRTMDNEYIESVWWAFKRLHEAGKIYEGEKVLPYCPRCATPVSKAEVAMDNSYRQVTDPSLYVKFSPLDPPSDWPTDKPVYFLAWTTTPWTLPANTGLAVSPTMKYRLVDDGRAYYWLGDEVDSIVLAIFLNHQLKTVKDCPGSKLVGLTYQPLFGDHPEGAGRILSADYVSADEGTGIVHLAPAYGEEDYNLAQAEGLPAIHLVDDGGRYHSGPWAGQSVWEASGAIIDHLTEAGRVLQSARIEHSYPHCHRCHTRLIYKAHPSWFFDVTGQKPQMLTQNETINWFPAHIKTSRFPHTINSAPDWNLSRDRFWATPLPVWQARDQQGQAQTVVVGSFAELADLTGQTLEDYHRPFVDELTFARDGLTYRRVDKVLDCWFDSGSMPFAQYHYPFENKELFEASFPADFIVEYVGQVRAWFYYLHVLAVALFDRPAFGNVIVTGTIIGSDGQKISKSLGNYTEPLEVIDTYSADAYRLTLMRSSVMQGEDFALADKDVADNHRKLQTLRNTLEFFLLYAAADQWPVPEVVEPPTPASCLDCWIISRLNQFGRQLTGGLESYNLTIAAAGIATFIDDLSNWYVRRSRRRFWKTENDADKQVAFATLHWVLAELARYLAPVCPFLAEEVYQQLHGREVASVHLADWPSPGPVDDALIEQMSLARIIVTDGLAERAAAGIKVRQPLAKLTVTGFGQFDSELSQIIETELNLKEIAWVEGAERRLELDIRLTPELEAEGLVRELVRHIQNLRKQSGLEVSDRIKLGLAVSGPRQSETVSAIQRFDDYIKLEVLAVDLKVLDFPADLYQHSDSISLGPAQVAISLVAVAP